MLLIIILLSAVIVFVEGKPLIRKNKIKEFITVLILLVFSIFLIWEKNMNLETPIDMLYSLLYPLGKMIFKSR